MVGPAAVIQLSPSPRCGAPYSVIAAAERGRRGLYPFHLPRRSKAISVRWEGIQRGTGDCRISVFAEPFETLRRKRRVHDGALDVAMAEVRLNCPRIDTTASQLISPSVAQHVRMHWKLQLGDFTCAGDDLVDGASGQRRTALTRKDETRSRTLSL